MGHRTPPTPIHPRTSLAPPHAAVASRAPGNYALFLADVRQQYNAAEDLYQRAIASDPNHANSLYNYAVLLDSVRNDYDKAEQLYKRAIAANPLHAYSLYNYALLLEDVRKDYDNAETVRVLGLFLTRGWVWVGRWLA